MRWLEALGSLFPLYCYTEPNQVTSGNQIAPSSIPELHQFRSHLRPDPPAELPGVAGSWIFIPEAEHLTERTSAGRPELRLPAETASRPPPKQQFNGDQT